MIKNLLSSKSLLLLIIAFSLSVSSAFAQNNVVRGVVTDGEGYTMPGVVVQIVGNPTYGIITDIDGAYAVQLDGSSNPSLQFTYIGMVTQTVHVNNQSVINIVMEYDAANIEEVVVIGFGEQKRVSVTGAVNSLKTDDLPSIASADIGTSLTGRMPGTTIVQSSGEAGSGATNIRIRGSDNYPLVLVDGIERAFSDLDMDEVESISILKDASATAVYGIRGGDGVIIVTTKRGSTGKVKVNFKTELSLLKLGKAIETMDAVEYATLFNEASRNDNGIPLSATANPSTGFVSDYGYTDFFTADEIDLYGSGKSLLYPNTNWNDWIYNEYGYRQRYNVNISGGNDLFTTYTSLTYFSEQDNYASYDTLYDSKSAYERYNVRTNIDFNLSKTSKLSVDVGGQFTTRTKANLDNLSSLSQYALIYPAGYSSFDGTTIYEARAANADGSAPISYVHEAGYRNIYVNKLQASMKFTQDLGFITEGLNFEASLAYDHQYHRTFTQTYTNSEYYLGFFDETTNTRYSLDNNNLTVDPSTGLVLNPITGEWVEEADVLVQGANSVMGASSSTWTGSMNLNFRSRLGYNRSFGLHNVTGMAVFTTNSQSYHSDDFTYVPIRYLEAATRLSYNYDYRYFLEFNGGYNGSETFAEENRFGFFPAVSVGYVPSNEPFWPKNDVFTFLKFRGSYGETGIDAGVNRFMYFDEYSLTYTGGYLFGSTPTGQGQALQTSVGNAAVTWATNYQRNFGLETKWFDDHLSINADVYQNDKKGILMEPNLLPSIIGADLPAGNIKEIRFQGYEIEASWQHNIEKFRYNIFANYSYANSINIDIDELTPEYEWQVQTGKNPNQLYGFNCVGFYTQDDIDALAANGGKGTPEIPSTTFAVAGGLQAGDLKYEDLNGDGTIDDNDKMYFENTNIPKTTFGLGGNFSYKQWSASFFFQGATDVSYVMQGRIRTPFYTVKNSGIDYVVHRWTQEAYDNGDDIWFPRLSLQADGISSHSYQNSTFWMKDASYLRLKSASVGYNLTHPKLKEAGIGRINFTLSGTNLWTLTSLEIVDPEVKSGAASTVPPSSVYTFAVNVTF